jgi:hypothetical protein
VSWPPLTPRACASPTTCPSSATTTSPSSVAYRCRSPPSGALRANRRQRTGTPPRSRQRQPTPQPHRRSHPYPAQVDCRLRTLNGQTRTATGAKLEHGVQWARNVVRVCSRLLDPFGTVGRGSSLLLPGGLRDLACRQRRVTASQMVGIGRARRLWPARRSTGRVVGR